MQMVQQSNCIDFYNQRSYVPYMGIFNSGILRFNNLIWAILDGDKLSIYMAKDNFSGLFEPVNILTYANIENESA